MKTKNVLTSLVIGFGLLAQALLAQGGPPADRGQARPDGAPIAHPEECPYYIDGSCPACELGFPEECPYAIDGNCPSGQIGPKGEPPGYQGQGGARLNPDADPKLDGTGGRGKPANPAGPQDGSAPGQGYRGGRG